MLLTNFAKWISCFVMAVAFLASTSAANNSQQVELQGSWNGNGQIVLPSGEVEKARCRATFGRQSASFVGMSAQCATASVRVAQTASLGQIGTNRFKGDFYNSEYAMPGTITITVKGDSLKVSLVAGGAAAYLTLKANK